jgi:hypothetical protein
MADTTAPQMQTPVAPPKPADHEPVSTATRAKEATAKEEFETAKALPVAAKTKVSSHLMAIRMAARSLPVAHDGVKREIEGAVEQIHSILGVAPSWPSANT